MTQFLLAHSRMSIHLGQELGRGGEGAVYSIDGTSDRVAKIYATSPDTNKVQKLTAMTEAKSPSLLRIAAWPIDLLTDTRATVRGFVMPRISIGRDIHELYSPKSRSEAFPDQDFRFLVHVGANIARAFATIHAQGHVVGDVNHSNLLVGRDGTVMLIDCDSFQIRAGSHVFTCDVGVPLFTAPELHGHPLRGVMRTPDHDLFGLAVLLFHLLYMGRHPFAGRFLGQGDMPIEKAVAEYRFAYGPDRQANGMERPPGTVPLEAMGATISDLFIRAFEKTGSYGGRPKSEKWIDALEQLEFGLRECSRSAAHHYWRELRDCPWCAIEAQTGVRLFGQRIIVDRATGAIDIATLWSSITSVPVPGAAPVSPSERPWHPPHGTRLPGTALKRLRKAICIGLVCSGFVACNVLAKEGAGLWAIVSFLFAMGVWPHVSAEEKATVERAYSAARAEWDSAANRWKAEASERAFLEKMSELEKARSELADLPDKRQRCIAKLESAREVSQKQRYLDRFRIDRSEIRGIGPSRTSMLASYGIETAADISVAKIRQIPGFGDALAMELHAWRKSHEKNFRFNPSEPINRMDVESMDRNLASQRENLLALLRQGADQLRRISYETVSARTRLMPLLERTWNELKLTEADRNSL